jgi:ParB family chromosome partitioning protein
LEHDGCVSVGRGFVRSEDAIAAESAAGSDCDKTKSAALRNGLPPRIVEDLTSQKIAAISAELMGQPDVALAAVVHGLALDVFYLGCSSSDGCVRLIVRSAHASRAIATPDSCRALAATSRAFPATLPSCRNGCSRAPATNHCDSWPISQRSPSTPCNSKANVGSQRVWRMPIA